MCLVACLVVWLCYSYIPVWQPELHNLNRSAGEIGVNKLLISLH